MIKKIFAFLLACALCAGTLSGCTSSGTSGTSNSSTDGDSTGSTELIDPTAQEETMDVSIAVMQGFTQADSDVQKMLEEKYNVNFDLIILPGWSDSQSKISLMMAGGDMPDMFWWWSMDTEYTKWVDAGLLHDVSSYVDKYTNIRDYYDKMDPKTMFYASEADGSMYRIPGDVSEPSCEITWIRQDWLDNLGLEAPTTTEELVEVLRAFTEDDPDGNGLNDTYGLGGDGYDFRSFWPFIQGYDQTHYNRFMVDSDGVVTYGPANDNTKNWISEVADLYAKGYITPNITQDTDRDEQMANGGFGVTYSWITWNNPDTASMRSFYANNPDAQWVPIDMITGSNGNPQEDPATSSAWCFFAITSAAENPERLYAMWDDMCELDNYVERRFGVEGQDFTYDEDGIYVPIIAVGSTENTDLNRGLALFEGLVNRKDEALITNIPSTTALFQQSAANSRDMAATLVEWKDPASFESWVDYRTDIEDEVNRYLWSVVAGTESVDTWDQYIATLYSLGLDEVLEEANEDYHTLQAEMATYFGE